MKTYVKKSQPWGLFARCGHRLLCSDGIVRAAEMAQTADTFFSIPASIRVKGKHISGYATTEEDDGGERVWCFRHHDKFKGVLPDWPECYSPEFKPLIKKGSSHHRA